MIFNSSMYKIVKFAALFNVIIIVLTSRNHNQRVFLLSKSSKSHASHWSWQGNLMDHCRAGIQEDQPPRVSISIEHVARNDRHFERHALHIHIHH